MVQNRKNTRMGVFSFLDTPSPEPRRNLLETRLTSYARRTRQISAFAQAKAEVRSPISRSAIILWTTVEMAATLNDQLFISINRINFFDHFSKKAIDFTALECYNDNNKSQRRQLKWWTQSFIITFITLPRAARLLWKPRYKQILVKQKTNSPHLSCFWADSDADFLF